jgi:peptide-methionine (S)-S-oxide reductase
VVRVAFDPDQIALDDLLGIFFATHDPTTLNRQGADRGTQYRSGVYYETPEQREAAERVVADLTAQDVFSDPIVTEIAPLDVFYPAEDYHQDYFARNPDQPYCAAVIAPKVSKLRRSYLDRLTA